MRRRRTAFCGNYFAATAFLTFCTTVSVLPAGAQRTAAPESPAVTSPAPTTVPQIIIGVTPITILDKTRQAYRDPADNYVCVPPEAVASVLGCLFDVDEAGRTATFTSNTTGASITVDLRTPPRTGDAKGAFVALTPLAEQLGGKCQYDAATDTLSVRSVLTLVEIVGSEVRVTGTLPLTPKITRINGGKTVAFDFAGAEVGLLPRNLSAVQAPVLKARTGQFDNNTARVVIELDAARPFVWVASAMPSPIAVLSSAPQNGEPVAVTPTTPGTVAPPVTVTVGADGKPLPVPTKPTKPTGVKPSAPTVLRGVRFVSVSDTQARIIVDAPNAPALKTLLTRSRLTLDVQNAVFGTGTQTTLPEAEHPLLKGVQSVNTSATTSQLLIDLSRAVNFTVRLNPKGGFTVDLTLPKGAGGRIAGKLIIVDAGHGGHDQGARGVNGAKEKNVALAIARKLAAELRDRGANVVMTRDSDNFVTLEERSNIANRMNADMFVAVHADSAGSAADGATTYYHLNDPSGRTLAQCVADRVSGAGHGIRNRGPRSDGKIYTNGFAVLRRTYPVAILCETGFMSNGRDVSRLVQDGIQAKIARAIASGVQDYIEGNSRDLGADIAPLPSVAASASSMPEEIAAPDSATQPER